MKLQCGTTSSRMPTWSGMSKSPKRSVSPPSSTTAWQYSLRTVRLLKHDRMRVRSASFKSPNFTRHIQESFICTFEVIMAHSYSLESLTAFRVPDDLPRLLWRYRELDRKAPSHRRLAPEPAILGTLLPTYNTLIIISKVTQWHWQWPQ